MVLLANFTAAVPPDKFSLLHQAQDFTRPGNVASTDVVIQIFVFSPSQLVWFPARQFA